VANVSRIVGPADLSETLCFDLCATGRAIARAYRPLLSSVGLTYPQYLVMRALRQRAPRTVTELGDRLALDSGTLSPLLKRLDASGLVTRGRRQEDERAVEVTLTPKGTALLREAEGVPTEMASVMGLSAGASRRLRTLLNQVTTSLARHHAEGQADVSRMSAGSDAWPTTLS
jgi:DNA-binding MarR family transcriptional regulator